LTSGGFRIVSDTLVLSVIQLATQLRGRILLVATKC